MAFVNVRGIPRMGIPHARISIHFIFANGRSGSSPIRDSPNENFPWLGKSLPSQYWWLFFIWVPLFLLVKSVTHFMCPITRSVPVFLSSCKGRSGSRGVCGSISCLVRLTTVCWHVFPVTSRDVQLQTHPSALFTSCTIFLKGSKRGLLQPPRGFTPRHYTPSTGLISFLCRPRTGIRRRASRARFLRISINAGVGIWYSIPRVGIDYFAGSSNMLPELHPISISAEDLISWPDFGCFAYICRHIATSPINLLLYCITLFEKGCRSTLSNFEHKKRVGFQVLTAASMKIRAFWDVAPWWWRQYGPL
jgi:hypothetical protein